MNISLCFSEYIAKVLRQQGVHTPIHKRSNLIII